MVANTRGETHTTALPAVTDQPPPTSCTVCSRPTKNNVQTFICPEPRPAWTYRRLSALLTFSNNRPRPNQVRWPSAHTQQTTYLTEFQRLRPSAARKGWFYGANPPPRSRRHRRKPHNGIAAANAGSNDRQPSATTPPTDRQHTQRRWIKPSFSSPKEYGVVGEKACGRG